MNHAHTECSAFMANRGSSGGIVAVSYAPVLMLGQENFINNTGSSLRVCNHIPFHHAHTKLSAP